MQLHVITAGFVNEMRPWILIYSCYVGPKKKGCESYIYRPWSRTCPKTELSSTRLQFHLLFRNCHWHSRMPIWAPRLTLSMWSWYIWQNLVCPGDRPLTNWQTGCCKPTTYNSWFRHTSTPFTPRFLETQQNHRWQSSMGQPPIPRVYALQKFGRRRTFWDHLLLLLCYVTWSYVTSCYICCTI